MKFKSCFIVLLITYVSYIQSINIELLKGPDTVLPEEDALYAPAYGLPFFEGNIAETIYMQSAKKMKKEIDKDVKELQEKGNLVDQQVIDQGLNSLTNSATENLVYVLANEVGGVLSATNAPDNPVRYLKPAHIGRILKMVKVFDTVGRQLVKEVSQ